MKKLTTFLAVLAAAFAANAATVTWNAADLTLTNNDVINDMTFTVNDNISFTVAKGDSDKDCVFRKSSTNPATVIVYSKGTITFNATDNVTLKSIKFVINTSEGTSNTPGWIFQWPTDKNLSWNAENDTWTGEATTVTFVDKSAAQITSLVIEYDGGTTPVDPTPGEFKAAQLRFSADQVATGADAQNVKLGNNGVTVDFTSNSANAQIDKSNGYFGTPAEYTTIEYRYRAGGKSSNGIKSENKGVITLPCDGTLTIYAYNNQTTDRKGQIVQGDQTVFDHTYSASEAESPEGSDRKVYPTYTVNLKKGTAYFLWPDNQLMLYGFDFEPLITTGVEEVVAAEAAEDNEAYDLMGRRISDSYKGIVIINGKKYLRK